MTGDNADDAHVQEWLARRERRSAWITIALGLVFLVAAVVLLVLGYAWSAGFVGGALAVVVIGVLRLGNARRTRARSGGQRPEA